VTPNVANSSIDDRTTRHVKSIVTGCWSDYPFLIQANVRVADDPLEECPSSRGLSESAMRHQHLLDSSRSISVDGQAPASLPVCHPSA